MYNDVMATVETDISSLQGYLRTDEDKELVQQFQSIMDQYQDTFYDASETAIQIGLSKGDEGLASEIRTLIAETEPLVLWLNRNWVRDQLEILQINVDDYIAHDGKTVELEIIQEDLYKIQKQIETAHLDSSKVKSLSASRESAGNNIVKITALVAELAEAIDRKEAQFANLQSIIDKLSPKIEQVTALADSYKIKNDQLLVDDTTEMATYFFISMAFMIVALAISMSIVKFGVTDPLSRVQNTIDRVREGEVDARCELDSKDELGQLSGVLDSMLEEKESALQVKEEENKRLNASIISLIQNVFQISQRDLTVRVPVAEDVTGAISDSINQLVVSIESVLQEVSNVSGRVNSASLQVKSQSETVLSYAEREKEEIGQTLDGLDSAIKAMELISKLAVISNNASQKAIKTSETAMDSVSQTIESINKIRQTIHEAEKRIKRLGERSQEIGGIVNLINNISERTHVLSLNASMHAASAGEAGRGLMVVVDEVQRLSENSREATSEIESLVNNIQLETADTINVINNVITDVVEGTRLAEEAGERMGETRTTTQTLVDSVVRIAHSSVKQAKVAEELRTRANSINETTQATNAEMRQQTELSDELVDAAEELQRSVSVFKLATS